MLKFLLSDQAFVLYLVTIVLSLYGFGLFTWWASRVYRAGGRISSMYLYLTLLFLSIAISNWFAIKARYDLLTTGEISKLITSWAWPSRLWLFAFILFIILAHMSYRVFWQRKKRIE